MTNKKFSDFDPVNKLDDGDYIPTERFGVSNNKISFSNFQKQIQDSLLKLSYSDIGQIKAVICEHTNGIPTNNQPNLIYCDGSTYYASSNTLIAKFIDYCYSRPNLKQYFQIPADKSSFKAPDLRNQHLVGAGSGNTALSTISSKSINFISGATTNLDVKLTGTASLSLKQNESQAMQMINPQPDGTKILYTNSGGSTVRDNPATTTANVPAGQGWGDSIIFNAENIGTDTSTATTTLNVNQSLVDNVNRVPALAVFWYLDIAVDRFTLDPNADTGIVTIDIDQVVGLQDALDSKVNITTLDGYATITQLNTALDGKANINHTHTIANITDLQTTLDSKANLLHTHLIADLKFDTNTSLENWLSITYAPIAHTHTIASVTGLQGALDGKADVIHNHTIAEIQELQNVLTSKANRVHTHLIADVTGLQNKINIYDKKRIFSRSWTTTTAGTIVGNTSVRILDRLAYNADTGIEPLNNTFSYTSGVNSFIKELNDADLPDKILKIALRIRNGSSMGNTQLEFSLFRQSDNTQVGGSVNVIINDSDTRGVTLELPSRNYGDADPFVTGGYYVLLRNLTGTNLAYNNIELLIQVIRDIGY